MRVKSHWFRSETPKGATEIAGAAAFIIWRIAQNALKTMRAAHYELPPGPQYFAFVSEFLAFLSVGADRIAYRERDGEWRVAFTTAMANRVGEILADNEADLLGAKSPGECKREFVALVNARAEETAGLNWTDAGPDYGFLRFLGHRVADVMQDQDKSWSIAQVIESEAPEAAETLVRAMAGLLDTTARPRRAGAGSTRGE
jgi:hypothetical protein